ncbi:hypothetical protein P7F88_15360 [Vibrio hannami]|uniref:hypothetical protein n=1 Tax=Vibrio hannami TaxID=2717094 RepID=UPI00240F1D64|nr:hypothetical protein [Vibrio hannami]MDG3087378.1 hypothetical protein [Vibrio hannami]
MRKHITSLTVGFWLTTLLVGYSNDISFYGTWVCVAIASALTAGLYFTRNRTE